MIAHDFPRKIADFPFSSAKSLQFDQRHVRACLVHAQDLVEAQRLRFRGRHRLLAQHLCEVAPAASNQQEAGDYHLVN